MAYMEVKYDTKRKEEAIVQQKAELGQQIARNERNVIIIIGLLIMLALGIAIGLLLRNKAQRKRQLLIQQQTIKLKEAQIEATLSSQETERKRFAEDLHDGFGQLISALRLNMVQFNQKDTINNSNVLENSEKILDEMHKEIRAIAFNLMPVTLIQEGLLAAIKEFSSRINNSNVIKIELSSFELANRFNEVFEVALYRIIQEWVNNILKYAEADKITIQLDQYEGELVLIIEDNGQGFDPIILYSGNGNGWRNIQTRANLINSQIEIDSSPNRQGTSFILTASIKTAKKEFEVKDTAHTN